MALMHSAAQDEILKNTFANNAFENFEIAAYKSLLVLCRECGASFAREPLLLSLKEEEAMAGWIDQNVREGHPSIPPAAKRQARGKCLRDRSHHLAATVVTNRAARPLQPGPVRVGLHGGTTQGGLAGSLWNCSS